MASLWQTAPLSGIKVVELAGLAPGPFAGLILADFGATVLRIDRAHPDAYPDADLSSSSSSSSSSDSQNPDDSSSPPSFPPSAAPPTSDNLTRHKSSLALNLKHPGGLAVLKAILATADVLIDPYRPGVLESLGLAPATLHRLNPRLIVARLTGFRRDGKYAPMAGHDINYLAVSGVLSQLGRAVAPPTVSSESEQGSSNQQPPQQQQQLPPDFPGNLLGDFAAGGLMCATGILLALLSRERRGGGGVGQVVSSNMVDGAAYLGTFLRLTRKTPFQDGPRGTNMLDGGSPWYDVYETRDSGNYMSVGALEPQFFTALAKGLEIDPSWTTRRWDRSTWPELRGLIASRFRSRTRKEWEAVFDGKDACCTPVLTQEELEREGWEQRAAVGLSRTPAREMDQKGAWTPGGLAPGQGGREVLREWLGWEMGREYEVDRNGTGDGEGGGGGLVTKVRGKL